MQSVLNAVICLLVASHVTLSTANDWLDDPYDNDDFNIRAAYLSDATLNCTDDRVDLNSCTPQYWILPDLTVMTDTSPTKSYFIWKQEWATWHVEPNNSILTMTNIEALHFGFYFCVLSCTTPPTTMVVKKAVNYKGPYFPDLWDEYEMQVIVGCSAAAALLLVVIVSSIVYSWKCKDPKTPRRTSRGSSSASQEGVWMGDEVQEDTTLPITEQPHAPRHAYEFVNSTGQSGVFTVTSQGSNGHANAAYHDDSVDLTTEL